MEPHLEHSFYTGLIVIATVCVATFIGALIDRIRFMRLHRAQIREMRRNACMRDK